MSNFKINDVMQMTDRCTNKLTVFRLLWKNELLDRAWIIEIPQPKSGVRHCNAPTEVSLAALEKMYGDLELVITNVDSPAIQNMSDEEIRQRYRRKQERCAALDFREKRWSWIEGLVIQNSLADIFEGNLITGWVNAKSEETKKTRAKIYNAIHSYYAGGSCKNALLGNWSFSGGKGQEREQTQKLGRPNAAFRAEESADKGYFLSKQDKEKIKFAWKKFLPGKSIEAAYLEMSGVFYRTDLKIVNGKYLPNLMPPSQRPTLDQFQTWGPHNDPSQRAWVIGIGTKDWMNNYRGLTGSSKDGIVAVGKYAFCDTTTNDAHLVSIASRLKPVGTVNRLIIHEAKSELIIGWNCSFEPPSTRTFLLAVAHAASSKVEYFARYGITIADDQSPAMFVKVYVGDNGEYRSDPAFKALGQFGSMVELAASGQAALKGPVEGLHHVLHSRLDHTLSGTTHGRQRKRGEANPILEACMTYYEYMHELLIEILYYNTEEIVRHLLTTEMRRDNVIPTRIEIHRWLVKKGYVTDFTPEVAKLRAHLYPVLPAVLTGTGIYLIREDRGDKAELVQGLRYMSDYLQDSGMLANARKNGRTRIALRGDPENPATMWLVTEQGLKDLQCITSDPILLQQGTVRDCIALQDDDNIRGILDRGKIDQRRSDIVVGRDAAQAEARREKNRQIEELPRKPSKSDLVSGISINRREETKRIDAALNPNPLPDEALSAQNVSNYEFEMEPTDVDEEDPARLALSQHQKLRGAP